MDINRFGDVTLSNNKKYIAFGFEIKNKKKESHFFIVYDDNFNKTYQTKIERNIKDRLFEYESLEVSDLDGTIYLIGKEYEGNSKKKKKKKKTNYHYVVYKITENKNSCINLKESNYFVGSLHILHRDNLLNLVGFYSEKNDYRYKGVFRYNLNSEDLTIINKSFSPFSDQFFEDKYKKGSSVKKNKKELKFLSFRNVFLDEKNNIIINAEEYYITTSYSANGTSYSHTTYHFDDIISAKISENGQLIWARNINKRQTGFLNSSFTSTTYNNKVYFFINISDKLKKIANNRISFCISVN